MSTIKTHSYLGGPVSSNPYPLKHHWKTVQIPSFLAAAENDVRANLPVLRTYHKDLICAEEIFVTTSR